MKIVHIILIISVCIIFVFLSNKYNEVAIVKSDIDNKKYIVRDLKDKKEAARTLSKINNNIETLIEHFENTNHTDIFNRLKRKYNSNNISEGTLNYKYTSYTVNKGEEIVFCLRDRKTENIHDLNTLMFVALHELAHIASVSEGHTAEFRRNFRHILKEAIKIGVYKYKKYSLSPETYCGTIINTDGI